jgi:Icc-related predicted phosphoesterase
MKWFFMKEEPELAEVFSKMPDNLDVLITHGPPYGILDPGYQADHVGSTALKSAVIDKYPTHHVFGHLHAAGGKHHNEGILLKPTQFHNVAACDDNYALKRTPYVFEI